MSEQLLQQILEELKGLNQRVGGIENEVKGLNQRIDGLENRMGGIENQIGDMQNDLYILKETTSRIETKQHVISDQAGHLSEYHTKTVTPLEQLATKEDLDYFDKKIAQHDREIFKIKNRA